MAKDVIELITADHRTVEHLFDRLKSGQGDRAALAHEVAVLLVAHSRSEEERVYPAVTKAAPGEKDEVDHAEDEHAEAERLAWRLARTDPAAKKFDELLDELVEAVGHHVENEESEVLPALREAVDAARLERLGEAFSARRGEELRKAGDAGAPSDGATRDELYREARQAEVPGRSQMNKAELADAVGRGRAAD
ncbi:hemerythrin domain-containing protein [Streptomyces sp. TRM 70351]|uniref:hemerythrin domain-containing protein n=1 Tax=Streptomyces sp. TRM 70351 TaxID=3116552 RepID=UPI002E7ADFB2|nr:hemerythrin domain-containing protein [Streptomyces sp. TRM 70351]MEE1927195.1 hemerythrin domain-containing protein [Streptomyces sp. TRM 70351]